MIEWPDPLVDKIARRNVVIMIGSGVSANAKDAAGLGPPTWYAFLSKAKDALSRCPKHITRAINQYNYLDACEYLRKEHGDNWDALLLNSFLTPNYKAAPIHEHIFNLDSRVVCSLNFDKIYDNFATKRSDGTYIIKDYWSDGIGSISSGAERYLVKIHGTIDSPDKLIFSTKDYALARNKYPAFYSMLDALILTHSFFIIGCGLNDPDLQLLFENYRHRYNLKSHYMTLPRPVHKQQLELIKENRGINIIPYSPTDGHEELTNSLGELISLVNAKRDFIAEKQSW